MKKENQTFVIHGKRILLTALFAAVFFVWYEIAALQARYYVRLKTRRYE